MPCVIAESAARFFIDEGLVFVCASCVFSNGNSREELPCITCAFGMRELADVAVVFAPEDGEVAEASVGCDVPAPSIPPFAAPFPDAAMMAFNSFSVTPAVCNAIRPFVDVSNFPGCDCTAPTTTDSGNLLFTMLITSALVSGLSALWPKTAVGGIRARMVAITAVLKLVEFISSPLHCETVARPYYCETGWFVIGSIPRCPFTQTCRE